MENISERLYRRLNKQINYLIINNSLNNNINNDIITDSIVPDIVLIIVNGLKISEHLINNCEINIKLLKDIYIKLTTSYTHLNINWEEFLNTILNLTVINIDNNKDIDYYYVNNKKRSSNSNILCCLPNKKSKISDVNNK
jgi:hypothetical protein